MAEQPVMVEFHAPLAHVQQRVPASYGTVEETSGGVRFETEYGNLADIARFLTACKLPFVVHGPPALPEELLQLAAEIARSASVQSGMGGPARQVEMLSAL